MPLGNRRRAVRQRLLPFLERRRRLERRFKWAIAATTLAALGAILATSRPARDLVEASASLPKRAELAVLRLVGVDRDDEYYSRLYRELRDEDWRRRRREQLGKAQASLEMTDRDSPKARRQFMKVAGLAPGTGLLRPGDFNNILLLSGLVYRADDRGRSYRLRPNTRSVWVRQVNLGEANSGPMLLPDTPELRTSADAIGGIVVDDSVQVTNSWGLRGPEPDPNAPVRGLVLGDSFMQGMFLPEDSTPPALLGRVLSGELKARVSLLNTGVAGYSAEQYYACLREYLGRFKPDFVVLSVYANDFGGAGDGVHQGGGDWEEAGYWLRLIQLACRERDTLLVTVPVPGRSQVVATRSDYHYPGRLSTVVDTPAAYVINPLDDFINANIRLMSSGTDRPFTSPLYNGHLDNDGHFSALGARVWAESVGRRLSLLLRRRLDRKPATFPNKSLAAAPGSSRGE
jgi:lysophospholipase L1-like esterase